MYRATHAIVRRPAAIKLLLKERAAEADLARFEREVQLTSRLAHPNTVSVFDYGRTSEASSTTRWSISTAWTSIACSRQKVRSMKPA